MSGAYPLDALERARDADVTACEATLAERVRHEAACAAEVAGRREALDAHDHQTRDLRERDRVVLDAPHTPAELLRRQAYRERRATERARLADALAHASAAAREAERAAAEARTALAQARVEREAVARHRARWEEERRRAAERRAEQAMDELASRSRR